LLYGVVAKNARSLELHLFLFHAKTKRSCALDKVEYQPTLGDLQMKTLDAEGRVRAALTTCKEVEELPAIYDASAEGKSDTPAAAVVPVAPPTVQEDEEPLPKAKPAPKPEPKVRPVPKPDPVVDPNADPYAGLLHDEDETEKKPWYKKWWPWTILGVVGVGAVGAAVFAGTRQAAPATGFNAVGIVP
jgi:outer membrane biosynthesis protein TonB